MLITHYEHKLLFTHSVVSILLCTVVLLLNSVSSPLNREIDAEKLSAYECGFNPFEQSREPFNIHFYVIGIMFIIFDVELVFLFPWVITIAELPVFSVFVMFAFLILLALGFAYEIKKGVLDFNEFSNSADPLLNPNRVDKLPVN